MRAGSNYILKVRKNLQKVAIDSHFFKKSVLLLRTSQKGPKGPSQKGNAPNRSDGWGLSLYNFPNDLLRQDHLLCRLMIFRFECVEQHRRFRQIAFLQA